MTEKDIFKLHHNINPFMYKQQLIDRDIIPYPQHICQIQSANSITFLCEFTIIYIDRSIQTPQGN